jgi:hypothetical protein
VHILPETCVTFVFLLERTPLEIESTFTEYAVVIGLLCHLGTALLRAYIRYFLNSENEKEMFIKIHMTKCKFVINQIS